jgi:hypothetical protein
MRSLTASEARVVRALLVDKHQTDREGERAAGVPRTTFQSIRRRVLLGGWLTERYIPVPQRTGIEFITFRIAQPFADRWRDALHALRKERPVVLWASSETFFSVIFGPNSVDSVYRDQEAALFRRVSTVTAAGTTAGVASYFDFEGAWARWALEEEPSAYPRSFRGGGSDEVTQFSTRSLYRRSDLHALVLRPFEQGLAPTGRLSISQNRLPRKLRALITTGVVFRRYIPDFSAIPSVRGQRLRSVVFVTGRLPSGKSGELLFDELREQSQAVPFLFATSLQRVLLAGLAPAPTALRARRTPIMTVLERHLQEIEVIREDLDSLIPVVNHRYGGVVDRESTEAG